VQLPDATKVSAPRDIENSTAQKAG